MRGYISYTPSLRALMEVWSISDQGFEAYRKGFCSRTLLRSRRSPCLFGLLKLCCCASDFSYIWITMMLIGGLGLTSIRLLLADSRIQASINRLRSRLGFENPKDKDPRKSTLTSCGEVRDELVGLMVVQLTTAVFGSQVPPLLLIAPVCIWCRFCTLQHIQASPFSEQRSVGLVLASNLLVQPPILIFWVLMHALTWLVAAAIFIDLEFSPWCCIFFGILNLLGICVVYLYHEHSQKMEFEVRVVDFSAT